MLRRMMQLGIWHEVGDGGGGGEGGGGGGASFSLSLDDLNRPLTSGQDQLFSRRYIETRKTVNI